MTFRILWEQNFIGSRSRLYSVSEPPPYVPGIYARLQCAILTILLFLFSLNSVLRWVLCSAGFLGFSGPNSLHFRFSCGQIIQNHLGPNHCSPFSVKQGCNNSRGNCWQMPICLAVHLLPLHAIRNVSSLKPSSISLAMNRDSDKTASPFCICPNMLIVR
jgi:hypothetical protein